MVVVVGAEDAALVLRHTEALPGESIDNELGDLDSALDHLPACALDPLSTGGELEVQVSEQRKEYGLCARVGGHATSNEAAIDEDDVAVVISHLEALRSKVPSDVELQVIAVPARLQAQENEPGEVDRVVELLDVVQHGDGGDTKRGAGLIDQAAHEAGAKRATASDSSVPGDNSHKEQKELCRNKRKPARFCRNIQIGTKRKSHKEQK